QTRAHPALTHQDVASLNHGMRVCPTGSPTGRSVLRDSLAKSTRRRVRISLTRVRWRKRNQEASNEGILRIAGVVNSVHRCCLPATWRGSGEADREARRREASAEAAQGSSDRDLETAAHVSTAPGLRRGG